MKKDNKETQTTLRIDKETLNSAKVYCIKNDIKSLNEFSIKAMVYCMNHGIIPDEDLKNGLKV